MRKKDVKGLQGTRTGKEGGTDRDIPETIRESGRGGEESEPVDENEAQKSRQGAIKY
jgi:hypothetical protein